MHGTTLQKFFRLSSYLIFNPNRLPEYVRYHPIYKKNPLDVGLPWYAREAIDFLDEWLKPDMSVFEWGIGGSTYFYAERVKSVTVVEHDKKWIYVCKQKLPEKILDRVSFKYCPLAIVKPLVEQVDFEQTAYVQAVKEGKYQAIALDGVTNGDGSHRPTCFRLAESCIEKDGIIVVDDIWMFPEILKTHQAKEVIIFESTGPCRIGVTQTAVFRY